MVRDLTVGVNSGVTASTAGTVAVFGGAVYFSGNTGTVGGELFKTDGRYIETQMEKGHLLSAQAAGKSQVTWTQAYNYWRNLAIRLGGVAGPKRQEYYECWYQAALTLDAQAA